MSLTAAAQTTPDEAFAGFVRPHWPAMATLARRLGGAEWEDVLQDALVLAWRKRGRFDASRGSERTWLLALTADAARKAFRRSSRTTSVELVDAEVADRPHDVDVDRALDRLTRRQRLAVELHYFLGLRVAEMAEVMRCAEGTVKSTLSDARARLRETRGEDYR